jgi:hypothetical protein
VIQITTFRLRGGVDEATFVAADSRYQQSFAYRQRGIRRRTLARGTDGEWVVITLWDSASDADAAAAAIDGDPEAGAWHALVDAGSWAERRYESLPG